MPETSSNDNVLLALIEGCEAAKIERDIALDALEAARVRHPPGAVDGAAELRRLAESYCAATATLDGFMLVLSMAPVTNFDDVRAKTRALGGYADQSDKTMQLWKAGDTSTRTAVARALSYLVR
jgi:hypothetical protein